jgi:hypothetical protein
MLVHPLGSKYPAAPSIAAPAWRAVRIDRRIRTPEQPGVSGEGDRRRGTIKGIVTSGDRQGQVMLARRQG